MRDRLIPIKCSGDPPPLKNVHSPKRYFLVSKNYFKYFFSMLAPSSSFRKSFLKVFFLLNFELWFGPSEARFEPNEKFRRKKTFKKLFQYSSSKSALAPFSSFRKSFLKVFFLLNFELWFGAKPRTQREIQKKKDLQKTLPGP